jgi:molecular chaperone GrpE
VSKDASEAFRDLRAEVASLRKDIAEDPVRAKAFEKLYEELRQYKEDFVFQAEKPLLLDLLLLYDSMSWFQERMVSGELSPDVVADNFQYLIDELVEVLYRRDVTPTTPGERFDRTIHKAVSVVATEAEADDQKIQKIVKRGFQRGERLLRPEEVVVARYRGGSR